MNKPKIIVTGGAGFIGSHTCEQLIHAGCDVMAIDDLSTGHLSNLSELTGDSGLRFEESDVAELDALNRLAESFRPDAIVHLAALVSVPASVQDPNLNFRQNVLGTHSVIEAARRHSVGRIVFASSAAIYGDEPESPLKESSRKRPLSPYGAAKLASESLLEGAAASFGLSVVANRYFNVYGPKQDPHSPYSGVISIFLDRLQKQQGVTIFATSPT